jgi:hypothetical protein
LIFKPEKEEQVDDWRYDFLKDDIKRLREDLSEVRERTWKVENWQNLVPLRILFAICWLIILGVWAAEIADASGAF